MAKPRRLTLLITLGLLITTASIVGHFAADVVCVALNAAGGGECATGNVTDGRPDSASPVTVNLHGDFNLPPTLLSLPSITLTFLLANITLAFLPYSPVPSPPPPKPLS